jgi:hypothetical protein
MQLHDQDLGSEHDRALHLQAQRHYDGDREVRDSSMLQHSSRVINERREGSATK